MSQLDCQKLLSSAIGQDLTNEDCRVLSSIVQQRHLTNHDILFSAGEATQTLFVILSGKIDVTKDTTPDEWITIHTLHAGDMAGEMSFIDGETHSLTLRAHGEVELLCLEKTAFENLLAPHPHLVYHILKAITRSTHNSLRRMNQQFIEMNRFINNEYTTYG